MSGNRATLQLPDVLLEIPPKISLGSSFSFQARLQVQFLAKCQAREAVQRGHAHVLGQRARH